MARNTKDVQAKTQPRDAADLAMLKQVRDHLTEFCGWFNEAARENGLDVAIDAEEFLHNTRNLTGRYLHEAASQAMLIARGLHKEQIQTALAFTAKVIERPGESGAVLGALQSGKTGTSHGLMFASPIIQMLTGAKYLPLYLNTSQLTHRTQSQNSLEAFLRLYGKLSIRRTSDVDHAGATNLMQHFEDVGIDMFEDDEGRPDETSVDSYMETAFGRTGTEDDFKNIATSLSFARVGGRKPMERLRDCFERANRNGYAVMMVVDEPQWGATDMPDNGMADGFRPSVLDNVMKLGVQGGFHFLDRANPNIMVGLSATPYAFMGSEHLFLVKQRIGPGYVGFGYFNGVRMCDGAMPQPPTYVSTDQFAGVGMNDITYQLFGKGGEMKARDRVRTYVVQTSRGRRPMRSSERMAMGAENLLGLLDQTIGERHRLTPKAEWPVGCLLRITNSRDNTDQALRLIGEDEEDCPYNIIRMYNDAGQQEDMAARIAKATKDDPRPYLVVVVGKGRMGDALPPSCQVSIDLAATTSDMNALLQGGFGRMCGYGKREPLVVMSARSHANMRTFHINNGINDNLVSTKGMHVHNAQAVPTVETKLTITREMMEEAPAGSPLALMLEEIQRRVSFLEQAPPSVRLPQRRGELAQAHEMALAPLLEVLPDLVRRQYKTLFPHLGEPPRMLGLDGRIPYSPADGDTTLIGWARSKRQPDLIRVLTRYNDGEERSMHRTFSERRMDGMTEDASSARRGDIWGATRMRNGVLAGVMPFITFSKVDEQGNTMGKEGKGVKGRFVFDAITFDLERPVHVKAAPSLNRTMLPAPNNVMFPALTPEEKTALVGQKLHKAFEKAENAYHSASGRRRSYKNEFEAILASDAVIRKGLSSLHDPETHGVLPVTRGGFQIISRKTNQLDNPNGPATVDFSDPDNVIMGYFRRGQPIPSLLDYDGVPAMKPMRRKRAIAPEPEVQVALSPRR